MNNSALLENMFASKCWVPVLWMLLGQSCPEKNTLFADVLMDILERSVDFDLTNMALYLRYAAVARAGHQNISYSTA